MATNAEKRSIEPQIIVAQIGAMRHYAVPTLLHQAGMLGHFYTDAYVGPGSSLGLMARMGAFLPKKWQSQGLKRLLGRRENSLPQDKITAFNYFGFSYSWALRQARDAAAREQVNLQYSQRFCELILKKQLPGADFVYAYRSAALPLFHAAHQRGMTAILEQAIAPASLMYPLLSEELRRWEGWEPERSDSGVSQLWIELEQQEWAAADAIISPSDFVAQGLASLGVPLSKIHLLPYAVELVRFAVIRQEWDGRRPLRVLFLGSVTLRKGPQYLHQALEQLKSAKIEARMVGGVAIQAPYRQEIQKQAQLTGLVPRNEILEHYQWADLFVFPTIFEGSATVIYEALAAGLPVITTPNAGSVVRDGIDGFIVPIRDSEALAEKIELLSHNPDLLAWMSGNAKKRSQEFSWERYKKRLIECIHELFLS